MRRKLRKAVVRFAFVAILCISIADLTACGRSTISSKEAGNRLKDIGHDFVTGERTSITNEFKREAYDAAVEYIKDGLNDPSKASFSECDEDKIAEDSDGDNCYYNMAIDVTLKYKSGKTKTISYYVKVLSEDSGYEVVNIEKIS